MKKIYQLVIILILLITVNYTGQAAGNYPITITDDLDRQVVIKQEPQRIVSLSPSVTEILYKLDLEDKVVGVTKFCNYPPQVKHKEKVSSKNIESIIAQKPDLVIAAGIVPQKVIAKLENLNIKIVGYKATSIAATITTIKTIAKISGRRKEGEQLAEQMKIELDNIKEKVKARLTTKKSRPTVFYEVWREPLRTVSSSTFINDLITTAGGKNIAAETKGHWPQYSLEQLLIKNPEVYIASTGSWKDKVTAETIKRRPNYSRLKAVKSNRIYVFDADVINRPGPRLIEGLKLFAKAIHPQIRLDD